MICFSISFQELLKDTKKSKGFLWKKKQYVPTTIIIMIIFSHQPYV